MDTHARRHLGVVDGGADHRAGSRAIERQPEQRADHDRHRHDEDAIAREAQRTHRDDPLQRRRHRDRVRVAAPDQQRDVLEDEREPDRHQDLPERLAGQATQEHALHHDADEREREGAARECQHITAGAPDDRQPDVAAEHEVGAMREVDDAHHAEDEGEPAREQEEQRAVRQAVEGLGDPEFCGHLRPRSRAALPRRIFSEKKCEWTSIACGFMTRGIVL